MIGPSDDRAVGSSELQNALSLNFRHPITDGPINPRSDASPTAGSSAELFNTAEEKFVEKRELTLVTFC
jgi:hypothetical protein